MAAQAGGFLEKLGGKQRMFPLLTVEDLAVLSRMVPNPNGDFITINGLDALSRSPSGCSTVIWLSLKKEEPGVTIEQISKMGSILRRCNIASKIITDALVSGEEQDADPKTVGGTGSESEETGI